MAFLSEQTVRGESGAPQTLPKCPDIVGRRNRYNCISSQAAVFIARRDVFRSVSCQTRIEFVTFHQHCFTIRTLLLFILQDSERSFHFVWPARKCWDGLPKMTNLASGPRDRILRSLDTKFHTRWQKERSRWRRQKGPNAAGTASALYTGA